MKRALRSTSDIISDLPRNIIESILVCLPIQDAVRTSLLSRRWRYKWITLPCLRFDDREILFSTNHPAIILPYKFFNFVDRVLLLHTGPVQTFKLSISGLTNYSYIDQYILFLSKHGMRVFFFEIRTSQKACKYIVPSCLFYYQQLSYLELHNCIFKLFSTNKGFSNLKKRHLQNIAFGGDDQFESMISCSPLLVSLIMVEFSDVTHLKICAPNLTFLRLVGSFESICFINTPHLTDLSIGLTYITESVKELAQGETCILIKVLGDLHGIVRLGIHSYFINYLAAGSIPTRLPTTCYKLKKLVLDLGFKSFHTILAALCLIRSAPNLQELGITVYSDKGATPRTVLKFLEMQNDPNFVLNQLRVIKMNRILGSMPELEFIKFLLVRSPMLETMRIKAARKKEAVLGLPTKLLRFRRASARAEIVYLDNGEN